MASEIKIAENDHPGSCKIDFYTLQREDVYERSGSMICFRQFFDEVTLAYKKQKNSVVRVSNNSARIYID